MPDSYFEVLSQDDLGGAYRSADATAGPWDPGLQHGGPPCALSVRVAEQIARNAATRTDLVAVRISADFVGPVPVGLIEVQASVLRMARTAVLVATTLTGGGRACLQARVWLVRDADTSGIAHPTVGLSPAEDLPPLDADFPYANSIEWRREAGGLSEPGPGRIWARPRLSLVDDEELMTGLQRVALVGDSASGVSSALDWQVWSFVNVDLDVHLARPVVGPWVHLDARTQLGGHGSALTRSTVSDLDGEVGSTAQTLVLAPRR